MFWSACGLELVFIGMVASAMPWLWMLLLTLPLLGLYLEYEKRLLQRLIVALLDDLAVKHELTKVPFEKTREKKEKTPTAKSGEPPQPV